MQLRKQPYQGVVSGPRCGGIAKTRLACRVLAIVAFGALVGFDCGAQPAAAQEGGRLDQGSAVLVREAPGRVEVGSTPQASQYSLPDLPAPLDALATFLQPEPKEKDCEGASDRQQCSVINGHLRTIKLYVMMIMLFVALIAGGLLRGAAP